MQYVTNMYSWKKNIMLYGYLKLDLYDKNNLQMH